MIFGLRSLKLFMAMKVVSIIMDVASRVFGLTLLDLQTSFTRKVSFCLTLFVLKLVVGLVYVFGRISGTNLGARNLSSFRDMLNEIGQVNIEVSKDTCDWSLGPKGTFTVKDARNLIDQKSLPSLPSATWEKSIPRKVNIFIWRLSLDRLPHRLNLSLRGMVFRLSLVPPAMLTLNPPIIFSSNAPLLLICGSSYIDGVISPLSKLYHLRRLKIGSPLGMLLKIRNTSFTLSLHRFFGGFGDSKIVLTFNSQPLRKSDIFYYVRSSSFSWLRNKGKLILSLMDWLKSLLMTAYLDNG
nr:RNA-directed DNA polymerase, eukaryota [Tanacetum cinerariifolium]